ncbi:hypothetical protein MTO96_007961 [Rhipicephalus appendiculatus]
MRVRRLYSEGTSLRGNANSWQRAAATVPSRRAPAVVMSVLVGPLAGAHGAAGDRSRDRQRANDVTVVHGEAGHLLLHVEHGGARLGRTRRLVVQCG